MRGLIIVPSLLARWWRFISFFLLLPALRPSPLFSNNNTRELYFRRSVGKRCNDILSCATASHFSLRLLLSARCLPTNSLSFNYYTPNNNSITHSLKRIFLQKKQDFKRRQHNRTTYYCRPRYYFVQPKITCRSTNHQVAVAAAAASRVAIEV